jgi:hypothetical protein
VHAILPSLTPPLSEIDDSYRKSVLKEYEQKIKDVETKIEGVIVGIGIHDKRLSFYHKAKSNLEWHISNCFKEGEPIAKLKPVKPISYEQKVYAKVKDEGYLKMLIDLRKTTLALSRLTDLETDNDDWNKTINSLKNYFKVDNLQEFFEYISKLAEIELENYSLTAHSHLFAKASFIEMGMQFKEMTKNNRIIKTEEEAKKALEEVINDLFENPAEVMDCVNLKWYSSREEYEKAFPEHADKSGALTTILNSTMHFYPKKDILLKIALSHELAHLFNIADYKDLNGKIEELISKEEMKKTFLKVKLSKLEYLLSEYKRAFEITDDYKFQEHIFYIKLLESDVDFPNERRWETTKEIDKTMEMFRDIFSPQANAAGSISEASAYILSRIYLYHVGKNNPKLAKLLLSIQEYAKLQLDKEHYPGYRYAQKIEENIGIIPAFYYLASEIDINRHKKELDEIMKKAKGIYSLISRSEKLDKNRGELIKREIEAMNDSLVASASLITGETNKANKILQKYSGNMLNLARKFEEKNIFLGDVYDGFKQFYPKLTLQDR